jgi:omega-hydroxy-beta-dihydromenaquinone-9 sulfotransferase
MKSLVHQPILGLPLGSLLAVLKHHHFSVDRPCLGRLVPLVLMGLVNSVLARLEHFQYGRKIAATVIDKPPLFILGQMRSGTTHLHHLLRHDEHFDSPSTYQAMFPHHFCCSQRYGYVIFDRLAPKTRPMDNMPFGAVVPYEDEFALAALSTLSPYLRFLFPRSGEDTLTALDHDRLPSHLREAWKASMLHFMKKLTFWKPPKRLLLKSPPHTGRLGILTELFPGAQFVHIVRNPYDVYLSTRHLWLKGLSRGHLQLPDEDGLDELILSWYTELFSLFERDRHLIDTGSLHELKFEDLETSPQEALRCLYAGLRLPGFGRFWARVEPFLESLKGYPKNRYTMDERRRMKVAERWGEVFERYGYSREC